MSTTIDEKVVEMRFDNKNFERNVLGTLSTLDKLKDKLNLTGASKGLENINVAANKVDMAGMSNAIETVHSKFSALEVIGITALSNITNSAVDAAKRFVSALTIAPVNDGFQEYEMTLNAVQTTMAGTGKTAEEVEEQLKRLDDYADKTVYSTSDMLNNLPKFTNAGVELEKATTAMIGIANATALAGGDASKASIAFYNLGQAIGTGYLTRMDYNSINNAGIATMEWKEQMVEAAIAAGTLTKTNDGLYKAGKKTYTIQQLFIDGLQEQWATTDVMMKVFQDYGDETTEIGKKAQSSAQDIKTFSMMMDSLKATAGTGWKDTWQLIFGDLEGAKKLWTGLNNFISGIINGMADFRNKLLESALGKNFTGLLDKVKKSADSVKEVVESVKNYADIVDQIIGGKWGNGQSRWDKLTEAGYDWAHAQNLVNEKLGNSVRHATDYQEAQKGIEKTQEKVNETTTDYIVSLMELDEATLKSMGYTDEQIQAFKDLAEAADKTGIPIKEFIENIDEIDGRFLLINSFKNLGKSLVTIFESIGKAWRNAFPPMSGDTLFNIIAGFHKFSTIIRGHVEKNADNLTRTLKGLFAILDLISMVVGGGLRIAFTILKGVLSVFNLDLLSFTALIGDALVAVRDFIENNIIVKGIEKIVYYIKLAVEAAKDWIDKNVSLTKGLENLKSIFAKIIDRLRNWTSYNVSMSKGLTTIKNVISAVSDKIKGWIKNNEALSKCFETIQTALDNVTERIKIWVENNEILSSTIETIKSALEKVSDKFSEWGKILKEEGVGNLAQYIIEGLANGLVNGAKRVKDAIVNLAKNLYASFCKFLGIQSPSKVFFEAGGDIVQGLVNGIKAGVNKVIEVFKDMINSIGDFDWTKLASIFSFLAALVPGLSKLNIGAAFARMMNSVGVESINGVIDGLKNGFGFLVETVMNIGRTILQAFRKVLGIESPSKETKEDGKNFGLGFIEGLKEVGQTVWNAIKNFGSKCIEVFRSIDFGKVIAVGLGVGILAFGIMMIKVIDKIVNLADKKLSKVSPLEGLGNLLKDLGTGLKSMTTDIGKGYKASKQGEAIRNMAIGIAILAGSIFLLSKIPVGTLWATIGAVAVLGVIMAGLAFVASKMGNIGDVGKSSISIIGLTTSLFLIALALSKLAKLSLKETGVALGSLTVIMGLLSLLLIAVGKCIKGNDIKDIHKVGKMIQKIAWALLLMVAVIKLASMLDKEAIIKGLSVIAGLTLLVGGLIAVSKLAGNNADKAGKMMSKFAWALLLTVGVIKLSSMLKKEEILKGIGVIVAVGVLFAGLVAVSLIAGDNADKAGSMILKMSAALLITVGVIKLASMLSMGEVLKGIGVIAAIGVLFAGLIAVSNLAGDNAIKAGAMILELSVALLIITGVLFILTQMDQSKLWQAVGVVAVLEALFAGLIAVSHFAKDCKGTIITITIAIGLLTVALIALSFLDPTKLAGATLALTSVLGMFALIVHSTGNVTKAMGTLIVLTVAIGVLTAALMLVAQLPVEKALASAGALSILLLAMSVSLSIISKLGPTAMLGVGALALLGLVVGELGIILGLMSHFNVEPSMETVKALSTMLLAMSGALVILSVVGAMGPAAFIGIGALATLITGIGGLIVAIGALVTEFPKLEEFLNTGIPVLEKIGYALGSFFGNILGGFLGGITSGLPQMGTDLSMFMTNAMPFIMGAKLIDSTVTEGIKSLAEAVLVLTAANVVEGLTSWITGGSSFVDFGKQLAEFGPYMAQYAAAVAGINSETVVASANAAKALSEIANNLPNSGGIASWFAGENDMNTFGTQLVTFGSKLKAYSLAVEGVNTEAITASANAAKALGEMASAIPNMGGMVSWFTGDNDLATFGEKLVVFGTKLKEYSTKVEGINGEPITASVEAAKALSEMASAIPNMGGMVSWFTGDNDLATFGEKLVAFGESLKNYSSKVSGIDSAALSSSTTEFTKLVNMAKGMSGIDFDGLSGFSKSLDKIGTDSVNKFVEAFENGSKKASEAFKKIVEAIKKAYETKSSDFTKIGKKAIEKFADGIKEATKKAENAIEKVLSNMISTIKDKYNGFYNSGEYVVSGFASGISANTFKAEATAKAMAEAALEAAREALREHSPSRAFYDVGNFAGLGFVNALDDYGSVAYNSGYGMAEMAKNGLSKAITKVSDLIETGMDTQPTIRPILDLSDVESGVGYIGSMFNDGPSIGVMSNLSAISSGMNNRNQNGTNNDVISAINKLRKDLGNTSGDTYNINGITYDDGSNVSNAVKELIRAAKVERRK